MLFIVILYVVQHSVMIRIANNANTRMDSVSRLGFAYKHPQYAYLTNEADTFLAGSKWFQLDEIEVYKKE
jgi:hypothetical protein